MKRKTKSIAMFLVLILLFNIFAPTFKVIANSSYTITFQVETGKKHTIEVDNGDLKIDGQIVELKDGSGNTIGTAVASENGLSGSITVNDSGAGRLIYDVNKFKLYNTNGHIKYDMNDINSDVVFMVDDCNNGSSSSDEGDNPPPQTSNVEVQFDSNTIAGNIVTYDVDGTKVTLTVQGGNISDGKIYVDRNNLSAVTFAIGNTFKSDTMQVMVRGADNYSSPLAVNSSSVSLNGLNFPDGGLHLSIEHKNNGGNPQQPGEDNQNPEDRERTINVSSTGMDSHVFISDRYCDNPDDPNAVVFAGVVTEQGQGSATFREVANEYYIHVKPDFFNGGRITSIKINGKPQEIQSPIGTNFYKVSPEDTYNIEVEGEKEEHYNIMWANDGADVAGTDYDDDEVKLKNGSAKVVKVYDNETDMKEITDEIDHSDEGCLDPQGKGYVSLAPGNVVIFEFEPQYGYQLTSVKANGVKLAPQETTNQYKYVMPETNIHFQATFSKTENTSAVGTGTSVTEMNYILDDGALDSGTAKLSIDKVDENSLTDTQKKEFASTAGDDYTVSTYLDVDLTQVWYKGKNDASDVWAKEIYDLGSKKATITIKLDEGITPEDVVILHELHNDDGTVTGYEKVNIINKSQDANGIWTVTFETSKFSNYAVASKKDGTVDNYTVTFNTNGGSAVEEQIITSGNKVTKPTSNPTKEGYTFEGWYSDETLNVEFDFNASITKNTTIYAKWKEEVVHTHSLTLVPEVSATCEKDGTKAHYKCSECGKIFADETGNVEVTLNSLVIKAVGHDWGEWVVTKEATTTEKGLKIRTCKNDSSHTETQEIPKLSSDTPNTDTPSTEPVVKVVPNENTSETNQATVEATELIKTIVNGNDVEGIDENLASEIITAVNSGKTIKIELATDKIDEKSIENDAKKVKDYIAKDTKIGAYYDIDVNVKIDGGEKGKITELNNAIKVTLPLPTDLPEIEDGYTRQYTIIRIHNGVAESIETSIENNEIVFNTDKFSTYALTYRDIENTNTETNTTEEKNEEKTKTQNETSSNPKTGDPIKLYISLLAISLLGLVTTRKMNKNSKSSKH